MSYNGSGTFVINTSGQPVVTGTVISSTAFNALTADLGTGLSTAITKDGQTTTTAKIPFAQGISAAVASNFAAGTVAAPSIYLSTDTGTGLYRIGANNDGFAISGTKLLDFGSALLGVTGALTVSTTLGVTGASTLAALSATDIVSTGYFRGDVGKSIFGGWYGAFLGTTSSTGSYSKTAGVYATANGTTGGTNTILVALNAGTNAANGSTVTTNYGLLVDNQTAGSTNYAIKTGTGLVSFGDALSATTGRFSGNLNADNTSWAMNYTVNPVVQAGQASMYGDGNQSFFTHNAYYASGWKSTSNVAHTQLFFDNTNGFAIRYEGASAGGAALTWPMTIITGSATGAVTMPGGGGLAVTGTLSATGATSFSNGYKQSFVKAANNTGGSSVATFTFNLTTNFNWLPYYVKVWANATDNLSNTQHTAWWLYNVTTVNGSGGNVALSDSGGDTAAYSIALSGNSANTTQAWTLAITATSLDNVIADVDVVGYGGVSSLA